MSPAVLLLIIRILVVVPVLVAAAVSVCFVVVAGGVVWWGGVGGGRSFSFIHFIYPLSGSPYLGKATAAARAASPLLSFLLFFLLFDKSAVPYFREYSGHHSVSEPVWPSGKALGW